MSAVFADAFYYIAMLNPADKHHRAAMQLSASLTRPAVTVVDRLHQL